MKVLALVTVCAVWLLIWILLKIHINFSYSFYNLHSNIFIDLKILFIKFRIELLIPREMFRSGLENLAGNLMNELTTADEEAFPSRYKPRRYAYLKDIVKEIMRHYVYSRAGIIWLKNKLIILRNRFWRGIHIRDFLAEVAIGSGDAALTGLLIGIIWTGFGLITARCHRRFTVDENKFRFHVRPSFDKALFLCRLSCILSLKISHIIFTAYRFRSIIFKYRRINKYG